MDKIIDTKDRIFKCFDAMGNLSPEEEEVVVLFAYIRAKFIYSMGMKTHGFWDLVFGDRAVFVQ